MTSPASAFKTGLLLAAGALFLAAAQPASAQSSGEAGQFLNRLNQLENQVQTLSRALFRGEKPADADVMEIPAGEGTGAPSVAAFETRLSQIEEQQRALTGQVEKLGFDLQQMKSQLERLQADIEQRFQQQAGQPSGGAVPPEQAPAQLTPSESGGSSGVLGTIPAGEGSSAATADALYEESFAFIRDAKYDQAESGFRQFLERYPDHALAANAQYWLGETYYVRGDYKQSAKMFAQGYQNFPKSSKARDSLLKLGLSLSKLGKKDDACLSLRQLEKEVHDEANPLRRRAVQEIKQLGCP